MRLSPLFFSEKQVNNVFQPNGSKKLVLDCQAMAEVVFAHLIGVLNAGEWDAIGHDNLGWNVGFMFDKFTSFAQTAGGATVQLNAVQDGDLIYIANNSHYRDQDVHPTGSEKGENAIKIATDSYQSWAGPPQNYQGWLKYLYDAYNTGLPKIKQLTNIEKQVPGYSPKQGPRFFVVQNVGRLIFTWRTQRQLFVPS